MRRARKRWGDFWVQARGWGWPQPNLLILLIIVAAPAGAAPARIDLVPFGRVVRFAGNTPETLEASTLMRSPEGWTAGKDVEGKYLIGLTWDEPRDVAEIELEFRDTFPDRDRLQVQYFYKNWP
ncbi:MAG: hypothetical protein KBH45_05465, partial [Verrucomicrobia bacterium]|nr:hypothetical protein [Verrucomicrobiota bacterium]